jgi:hypothetical protein
MRQFRKGVRLDRRGMPIRKLAHGVSVGAVLARETVAPRARTKALGCAITRKNWRLPG